MADTNMNQHARHDERRRAGSNSSADPLVVRGVSATKHAKVPSTVPLSCIICKDKAEEGNTTSVARSDIGELATTAINILQGRESGTALHLCYTDPSEEGGEDCGAKSYDAWVTHDRNYNFHDEVALIAANADEIVKHFPDDTIFVEMGPGGVDNGYPSPVKLKTRILVEAFERVKGFKAKGYHAIDTNERYAEEAAEYISAKTGVENRGHTVSDYRKRGLDIQFGEGTPVLIAFGGTLMNLPVRQDTSPKDALKRNIQYIYDLISKKNGLFFSTHDETSNKSDIIGAYDDDSGLVKQLGKTFLHRIFNELATENFSPDDFDMEIKWGKVEGLNAMTVVARANKDKHFKINGIPLSMKSGQEFDLAYSFKQNNYNVQEINRSVGFQNTISFKEQRRNRINSVLAFTRYP